MGTSALGGVVTRVLAQIVCHVRYGVAQLLAVELLHTKQVATLTTPSRAALRALSRDSGALVLLTCIKRSAFVQPPKAVGASELPAHQAWTVLFYGCGPVLTRAQELIHAWEGATGLGVRFC